MNPKINLIWTTEPIDSYKGVLNSQNQPHGRGRMMYLDGSVFEGFFCNGLRHGRGRMRFANGNEYSGQYFNNVREGYGEFFYADTKESYIGYWKNDLREGKGEYRFKDGSIFRGAFKRNVQHGVGRKMCRKMVYKGSWNNGKKHGVFKFKHIESGRITLVKFVDDRRVSVIHKVAKKNRLKNQSPKNGVENRVSKRLSLDSKKRNFNSLPKNLINDQIRNKLQTEKNIEKKSNEAKGTLPIVASPIDKRREIMHAEDFKEKDFKYLSVIGEVSENKFSTHTDEPKAKFLFTFDRLSALSSSNKNPENFSVTSLKKQFVAAGKMKSERMVGNSNGVKTYSEPGFNQNQLNPKRCEPGKGSMRSTIDSIGPVLKNGCTSIDLENNK